MYRLGTHIVPDNTPPDRLSDYVVGIFSQIPTRKGMKKAIKRGQVWVDDEPGTTGQRVRPGQRIELYERTDAPPKPLELPLEIIWQDEHLGAVVKPAGLVVSGNRYRTLYNALPYNLDRSQAPDALPWPLPAHRLDAPTTGIVLVARSRSARVALGQMFREGNIHKTYQAIVTGQAKDKADIRQPLDGKSARTEYRRTDLIPSLQSGYLSWLEIRLHTGRTHQIRRHLADSGLPILGDKQYAPDGTTLRGKGLFLAATSLQFQHPVTGAKLQLQTDAPPKFRARWKLEKRRWKKFEGQ